MRGFWSLKDLMVGGNLLIQGTWIRIILILVIVYTWSWSNQVNQCENTRKNGKREEEGKRAVMKTKELWKQGGKGEKWWQKSKKEGGNVTACGHGKWMYRVKRKGCVCVWRERFFKRGSNRKKWSCLTHRDGKWHVCLNSGAAQPGCTLVSAFDQLHGRLVSDQKANEMIKQEKLQWV